ncbi:TonB-dependent receptor [Methylotenera sp.]|uniref:TonB-dependent receptor n=1 Tax=Methylotenera sp. TaxID=2051956 RepID=UPI002487A1EA|nr:TonB-dependent receptor [Methylotenera sp.]MDI1362791.1 TonB-dependent receptor [Methylotenera sp.]
MSLLTKNHLLAASFATLAFASSTDAFACSSCGCTLNSDWSSQGISSGEGTRFDIRFDYFKQSDYRNGTSSVSRSNIPVGTEVQDTTINRNLTLGLDHSFNQDWAINLLLPIFNRSHGTYGEDGDYPDPAALITSSSKGIGDLRVTGRYQGLSADRSSGVTFGLKLPTGETNDTFNDGSPLDRGLQLGTGTTDLLLGGYYFGSINRDWDYFAQATVQIALNKHDDFRPGNGLNATAGVRYMGFESFIPQLQLNTRIEKRESGAEADVDNSGATLIYISPGVTVPINKTVQAFGFIQVPIYQHVNGYQVEPNVLLSTGLRFSF